MTKRSASTAASPGSAGRGRRIGHLVVILVGLLILAYPFTLGAEVDVSCYGRPLQPGQSCPKADGSRGQTYEQRVADARAAEPVVLGVGAVVAGFGVVLLVLDLRRRPGRDRVQDPAAGPR